MHSSIRHGREKEFHDSWAGEMNSDKIDVRKYFEGSTCPENKFILSKLGSLEGLRVLDLGCGAGESGIFFALHGAKVVLADTSEGMLSTAQRVADNYGVCITTKILDAEQIDFPDEFFDIVYSANTLHHVDEEKALAEIYRVLRPGGKFCSWDPMRHNPLINLYRLLAKKVRTIDEHPLSMDFVRTVRGRFNRVEYDVFWLATQLIFMRFFFIERINPNEERYWKKIIYEEERLRSLYVYLERWDLRLKRIACLRRMAWNLAIVAIK